MASIKNVVRKTNVSLSQPRYALKVRPAATINTSPSSVVSRYEHVQSAASSTWLINHNLGRRPQVEVFSPGWVQVEADVVNLNDNQTQVNFNTPQTGQAILS